MAIQMRRGNKADFDPSKMLPGEWAVAIDSDTQNQIVWMCFRAGVVKRMGTYEDFKEQIREATAEIKNEYKEEFQTILGEIEKLAEQTSENRNTVVQIRDDTVNTYLPKMLEYVKKAESSAEKAEASQQQTAESATKAQSYAVGGTGSREGEDSDNAKYYYEQVKDVSEAVKGGLQPRGTVAFVDLPQLADVVVGWMFNVSDEFTTTADFKEGAGNVIPAGANIYKTSDEKWDVLAGTPVTGIKGDAEASYRRGNVNITPENIGAYSKDDIDSMMSNVSIGMMQYLNVVESDGLVSKNMFTTATYLESISKSLKHLMAEIHSTYSDCLPLSGGTITGNISTNGGATFATDGNVYLNSNGYKDWLTNILNSKLPTSASCNKNWEWTGKEGQPSWLWGGNDIKNMYVYNPSNFRVAYARDTAGVIAGAGDVRVGFSGDGVNFRTYNKAGTAAVNGYTNLGSGSYRWKQLFATTATISTSDRNLKKDIHQLTDTHLDFFLKLQPVSFLFKDGESGRTHIGFIAQDVEQAMSECGLTDLDFAGFCKDQKVEVFFEEDENGDKIEKERPILDENGNPEYIYSLRYEEFIALNTYVIQKLWKRVDAVEKENIETKNQTKSMQQDIAELKKSRT